MVGSYSADTDGYLVWSWGQGGWSLWCLHSRVLCPSSQMPASQLWDTASKEWCELHVYTSCHPRSQRLHAVLEGKCKIQDGAEAINETRVTLTGSFLGWNQKPLHDVKRYQHFTGKEVDSEVEWLSPKSPNNELTVILYMLAVCTKVMLPLSYYICALASPEGVDLHLFHPHSFTWSV
jgi:hypothetical protein